MRRLILCADDFGYNQNISSAIIELVKRNLISATSCMTDFPAWDEYASELKSLENSCDVGLHFNLTDNYPENSVTTSDYSSLSKLMSAAILRKIDVCFIENEFDRQIGKFVNSFGRLPDYIDGHQHVHQFPVIQSVIVNQIEKYYKPGSYPYVRVTTPVIEKKIDPFKAFIILLYGAHSLKKKLIERNIKYNKAFAGIYKFKNYQNFPVYMESWLDNMPDSTLMMCHPGSSNSTRDSDPISESRYNEYDFLKSNDFSRLCEKYNINISRFHQN